MPVSPLASNPSPTVLLVDDSEHDRQIWRYYLNRQSPQPYSFIEVDTGGAALTHCRGGLPDCILLDYRLPDLDGLAVLAGLRQQWPDTLLPVLFLTGQGDEELAVQAMKGGAQDYLVKGRITAERLHQALESTLTKVELTRQLERQQQRQQLVYDLTQHIRQLPALSALLAALVDDVRQFLQADRVLVYQFADEQRGDCIAESVAIPWTSCLQPSGTDLGWSSPTTQTDDRSQAQAQLAVPILLHPQSDGLALPCEDPPSRWGLLVVQQCGAPRHWSTDDQALLNEVAAQVAIAIQQSQLCSNLYRLNSELERRVEQRTQELRQSEARTQAMLQALPDLIIRMDVEGNYLDFFSGGDVKNVLLPNPIVTNNSIFDVLDSAAAHQRIHYLQQAAQSQTLQVYEQTLTIQGELHYEEVRIVPCGDAEALVVIRDTTERRQAEQALQQLNQELEQRVTVRTQELAASNCQLRVEIQQREQVENALRESQQFIASIADRSPNILYIYDLVQRRYAYINRSVWELAGYSSDTVLTGGSDFIRDCMHPKDWLGFGSYLSHIRSLADGEIAQTDYRIRRADGQWRWFHSHDAVFKRDAQGRVTQFVGTAQDITERKQAEAALRQSEDTLRALIRAIPDLLVRMDEQGNFIDIFKSDGVHLLHPERVRPGANIADILPQPLAQERLHYVRQVLKTGQLCSHEYQLPVEGQGIYEEARLTLCEDNTVLVMVRDISARKQAEDTVRRNQARFQRIAANVPGAMYQFIQTVDGQYHFPYMSDRIHDILGVTAEHMQHNANILYDLVHADDLMPLLESIAESARHLTQWFWEGRCCTPQGQLVWLQGISQPVLQKDGSILWDGLLLDITTRKQAEEDIRRALQREKELNELKSRFISMTSHEFRTPLAVIASSAGILKTFGSRLSEGKKQEHLATIQTYVRHTTELLDDILLLNRAEVGKLAFEPAALNLVAFCQTLTQELQLSIEQSLIFTVQPVVDSAQDDVWMDKKLLRQILLNLLVNAAKYSPESSPVHLTLHLDPQQVRFEVQDWGIGIPAAEVGQLFEAFYRASNVGAIQGTGLGLSVVKRGVERHGGTLDLTSELGRGTLFTVTLPRFCQAVEPESAEQ